MALPSVYHGYGMRGALPEQLYLCLLPNSLKLQFTSKCHCHLILTQMSFLPSAPRDANCEPHVSAPGFSPQVSEPKALWTCYLRAVWRSRGPVPAPAQPCPDAIPGLWAGAGWHLCMELGHRESCLMGLDSDFCYEAQNPTTHNNYCAKNQGKCSHISLMANVINRQLLRAVK